MVQFRSCGDPYWSQVPVGQLSAYAQTCSGEGYPKLMEAPGYLVLDALRFPDGWQLLPNVNRPNEGAHESHVWMLMTNGSDDLLVSNLGLDAALGYPGPIKLYLDGVEVTLPRNVEVTVSDWVVTEFVFESRGFRWQALMLVHGETVVWTLQETQGSLRTGWIEVQTRNDPDLAGLWADAVRLGRLPENIEDYIVSLELEVASVKAAATR